MSRYSDQNSEIVSQLQAVAGIGTVYGTTKNPVDEQSWNSFFVDPTTKKVNVTFIDRLQGPEKVDAGEGGAFRDETDEIEITSKTDTWQIILVYGFHDDADPSLCSDFIFNTLVDAVEDQFRFLQNLGVTAFKSFPLSRTTAGLFAFVGGNVLCHKAVWTLQVVSRIFNTN